MPQAGSLHASQPADRAASPWLEPGPRGERLTVPTFPTYMLGRLSGIARRSLIPRYVEPFGLTIPEWRLLAFLADGEPVSFNELCALLTMDRAQVSRTVPALIAKGLVERRVQQRAGPRRRGESARQTKLAATAKGRAVYRKVLPVAQRHQMVLLNALSPAERAAFHATLLKLLHAAESFENAGPARGEPRAGAPREASIAGAWT